MLEHNGFTLIKEKGSIRYYGKPDIERWSVLIIMAQGKCRPGLVTQSLAQLGSSIGRSNMINLKYSLVIEATDDPTFFGFYSSDLQGFSGVGHSIEDCLYQARWGMEEHLALLKEKGLPIPTLIPNPTVIIQNEKRVGQAV